MPNFKPPMTLEDSLRNKRVCYFRLGDYKFIIEGRFIKQIINLNKLTPIPRSSPELWGLMSVEGSILPLVNSYQLFKLKASQAQLAIILELGNHKLAFAIDSVDGFQLFDGRLEASSAQASSAVQAFLSASFTKDDSSYYLLDVEQLLTLTEQALVLD